MKKRVFSLSLPLNEILGMAKALLPSRWHFEIRTREGKKYLRIKTEYLAGETHDFLVNQIRTTLEQAERIRERDAQAALKVKEASQSMRQIENGLRKLR